MTKMEFADFCSDLVEYFGRASQISERRLELWYGQCHYVPGEALGWIKDRMFREMDRLPTNLPKAIRQGWAAWQEAHPSRLAAEEDVQCNAEGCCGGWIHVRNPETGCDAVAMCDQCAVRRRLTTEGSPYLDNAADLRAKGWEIKPPPVTLDDLLQKPCGFRRRAASAIKSVPPTDAGAGDEHRKTRATW